MTIKYDDRSQKAKGKHLADDSGDNAVQCQCMPQLHYNKKKEDEAQVKGENCTDEGSKNMAIYIT
jgi:hypothetical protein